MQLKILIVGPVSQIYGGGRKNIVRKLLINLKPCSSGLHQLVDFIIKVKSE